MDASQCAYCISIYVHIYVYIICIRNAILCSRTKLKSRAQRPSDPDARNKPNLHTNTHNVAKCSALHFRDGQPKTTSPFSIHSITGTHDGFSSPPKIARAMKERFAEARVKEAQTVFEFVRLVVVVVDDVWMFKYILAHIQHIMRGLVSVYDGRGGRWCRCIEDLWWWWTRSSSSSSSV